VSSAAGEASLRCGVATAKRAPPFGQSLAVHDPGTFQLREALPELGVLPQGLSQSARQTYFTRPILDESGRVREI
jgi:hypothetical protein